MPLPTSWAFYVQSYKFEAQPNTHNHTRKLMYKLAGGIYGDLQQQFQYGAPIKR